MNYVLSTFIIGTLILIHELGHYVGAKISGIPVKIFSIGFGPKLFSKKLWKTEFRISWIPIGGYLLPDIKDEDEYFSIPISKRFVLSFFGPLFNILFTVLCFIILIPFTDGASFYNFAIAPFVKSFQLISDIFYSLVIIFTEPSRLSGIIGIVDVGAKIATSFSKTLYFAALLSINLGVFNLLPLPALDGGKIILMPFEKISPKLSRRLAMPLAIAGLIFIVGLFSLTTYNDVVKFL
jgi:regulator of sigma E protease